MNVAGRKRWAATLAWLGRNAPWIVIVICALIVIARPVYAQLSPDSQQSWVVAYKGPTDARTALKVSTGPAVPAAPAMSAPPTSDEAFGRHLDTLTEFYDKLINFLFLLLGTITALAFFTIRANTKAEQEKAAFEAIESDHVKGLIAAKVSEEVAAQIGDIKATLEELQALYEILDDAVIARQKKGEASGDHQTETPSH